MGSATYEATCGLSLTNSVFNGNTASHAGGQVYMTCIGDVWFENTTMALDTVVPEVVLPTVGNVTMLSSSFLCPVAANFVDDFGGLYGADGAYPLPSRFCNDTTYLNFTTLVSPPVAVLVSTLQFRCRRCGFGTYSVLSGMSSGAPNDSNAFPCLACPKGGQCETGVVVASPGYWGGGTPEVSFGTWNGLDVPVRARGHMGVNGMKDVSSWATRLGVLVTVVDVRVS